MQDADVTHERRIWLRLMLVGTVVWLIAVLITIATEDVILVPTVILVGSFLVPATVVAFALSRPHGQPLEPDALILGFLAAATLGVVLSALAETYLLPSVVGTFAGVGLIEEVTKGAVIVAVARRVRSRHPRDGMILGAIVGAGFASFESAGYALSAVAGHADDHPILHIIGTEATRAVLAPFGHITWTALLGGVLFACAAPSGAIRLRPPVLWTLAGIVLLHAAWDASYGVAIMITQGLVGSGWHLDWPNTEAWIGEPTGHTLVVFQAVYDVLLAMCAAAGIGWIRHRWRAYGVARDRPRAVRA
jgi:RsiW-degrading membrane proteinase PrsW (M82 family)